MAEAASLGAHPSCFSHGASDRDHACHAWLPCRIDQVDRATLSTNNPTIYDGRASDGFCPTLCCSRRRFFCAVASRVYVRPCGVGSAHSEHALSMSLLKRRSFLFATSRDILHARVHPHGSSAIALQFRKFRCWELRLTPRLNPSSLNR